MTTTKKEWKGFGYGSQVHLRGINPELHAFIKARASILGIRLVDAYNLALKHYINLPIDHGEEE